MYRGESMDNTQRDNTPTPVIHSQTEDSHKSLDLVPLQT